MYRIGVDVGGTNTDAAILDVTTLDDPEKCVLASYKTPTTTDVTTGIQEAVAYVLRSSTVDTSRLLSVTIGTTHFINAFIEADARSLDRVAVVRLCGPFTRQIPPFSGFPLGLLRLLDGGTYYLDGGLEIDGREIAQLNEAQITETAQAIAAAGVQCVALVGVFSPLDHGEIHERRCRDVMMDAVPGLDVVCSRDIGPTGLLERENATIINAAILRTSRRVKECYKNAMERLNLDCQLYLSQNDGSVIDIEAASNFPIKTFASGPTNSVTGAAFLAGIKPLNDEAGQVIVVDVGGTSTDVCALLNSGFPRQASGFVELAGVRTAFSMPEVVSIGLGGGSIVDTRVDEIAVGPESVGASLQHEAMVFGGATLTATDVAVAHGHAKIGNPVLVKDVEKSVMERAYHDMAKKLERVVDHIKVSDAPVTALLVGGGAVLVPESLRGVQSYIRPVHYDAANAVGAAIGKISGEADVVQVLAGKDENKLVESVCKEAIESAVARGAHRDDVRIVDVQSTPLQYMSQPTLRIQARATGRLALPEHLQARQRRQTREIADEGKRHEKTTIPEALTPTTRPSLHIDLGHYRPDVRAGIWYVSEVDLELVATGCGVLGTGGGGSTYYEYLTALNALRSGTGRGRMRVISSKALNDRDTVAMAAWYGSPSVSNERIAGGTEIIDAIAATISVKGVAAFQALLCPEIGGGNGLSLFPASMELNLPVVDGDGMGRAYPTMYHVVFSVYGYPMTPCSIADARRNTFVVTRADSPGRLEKLLRIAAEEFGLSCAAASNPMTGAAVKTTAVKNTISQAWYLGRAVHLARRSKTSFLDAIFDVCAGKLLYTGKITNVQRHVRGGYTKGTVILGPLAEDERDGTLGYQSSTDKHMIISFQNEYLYAAYCNVSGSKPSQEVVCTVPHLISILGQDGEAIGSQDLRYGLRGSVIALSAHPAWQTEEALKVGGPVGFGLDMSVVGVSGGFAEAPSVIDEFSD